MKPLHRPRKKPGAPSQKPPVAAPCSVYTLRFPDTRKVFYVGIAEDPYKRFMQHLSMDGSNQEKDAIIADLKARGLTPLMQVEGTCPDRRAARHEEAQFTGYYLAANHPLTNQELKLLSDAENGRYVYRQEQQARARLSTRNKRVMARLKTAFIVGKYNRDMYRWQLEEDLLLAGYR